MGNLSRYRCIGAAIACGVATMMLGAAPGVASASPAVTLPATSVTGTTAALNGTISPGGLDTFWGFQYGTSTAYGQNTAPSGPLTGTGGFTVLAPISGLQPGTTYHFRLVAVQGAAGASGQPTLSGGADMSFTTPTSTPNGSKHSRATLRSRTLTIRHGNALIPWRCSGTSGAACRGHVSLTARGKVAGKLRTVRCGAGGFVASTGTQRTVSVHLGGRCLSWVKHARHHRRRASLKATFSEGTGNLKTPVTLVLA